MSSAAKTLTLWNRRLHFYIGLYFLLFLWLFSFTGLLLNHPGWKFAAFWPGRKQSDYQRSIAPPPPGGDLAEARGIMRQLGIEGEIEWTQTNPAGGPFAFRVSRPGHILEIKADLANKRAEVHRIDVNLWGVAHILHTFSGVRMADPRNARDWDMTELWAFSMDALAIGLIAMVLSSLYLWWKLPQKRRLGLLALALGLVCCGFFVAGLRWLSS